MGWGGGDGRNKVLYWILLPVTGRVGMAESRFSATGFGPSSGGLVLSLALSGANMISCTLGAVIQNQ